MIEDIVKELNNRIEMYEYWKIRITPTLTENQKNQSDRALLEAITYIEDVYQHSKLTDDSNRAYDALIQIRKIYSL